MTERNFEFSENERSQNDSYNQKWIMKNNLIGSEIIELDNLDIPSSKIKDAGRFQVVWLQNIDRLMKLLPSDIVTKEFSLIDVGCGTGISTLYFASNYKFFEYCGFDHSQKLISMAHQNFEIFSKNNKENHKITFNICDANTYSISKKSILFLYNPFGSKTLKNMILNNIDLLKSTNSIMLYANDLFIDDIKDYGKIIGRHSTHNLSCLRF